MIPSWNSLRVEGWRQRLELPDLQPIHSGPLKSQLPYLLLLRLHMQAAAVSSSCEQYHKKRPCHSQNVQNHAKSGQALHCSCTTLIFVLVQKARMALTKGLPSSSDP